MVFSPLLIYIWTSGNLFIFGICQKTGELKYLWLHSIHEMCTASAQALVSSMPSPNAPLFYWGSTLLHQHCLISWYCEPAMYIKICNSQPALSQGSGGGGGDSDGALVLLLLFLTQPKPKKLYLQEIFPWKCNVPPPVFHLSQSWPCFLRIQAPFWEF